MSFTRQSAAVLFTGLLIAAPLTFAQSGAQFSKQDLQKYAEAQQEIQEINEEYRERMQQAEERATAIDLQQQAQKEMVDAVRGTGLTVRDYNEITEAVRRDPEVRARVLELQRSL